MMRRSGVMAAALILCILTTGLPAAAGVAGMIPGTEANREKRADQQGYGSSGGAAAPGWLLLCSAHCGDALPTLGQSCWR